MHYLLQVGRKYLQLQFRPATSEVRLASLLLLCVCACSVFYGSQEKDVNRRHRACCAVRAWGVLCGERCACGTVTRPRKSEDTKWDGKKQKSTFTLFTTSFRLPTSRPSTGLQLPVALAPNRFFLFHGRLPSKIFETLSPIVSVVGGAGDLFRTNNRSKSVRTYYDFFILLLDTGNVYE